MDANSSIFPWFARAVRCGLVLAGLFAGTGAIAGTTAPLTVLGLRCEELSDPRGIDTVRPRLSWKLESNERGQMQTV